MIIILEGPDGSGKTTLAKKLVAQTGYAYIHKSYPKTQEEMENMFQEYKELLDQQDNLIIDRSWFSEMVYGPILRSRSYITMEQALILEQAVAARGGLIIYCTGNIDNLWYNCLSRGEDLIRDYKTFAQICTRYTALFSGAVTIVPVVKYEVNLRTGKEDYAKLFRAGE